MSYYFNRLTFDSSDVYDFSLTSYDNTNIYITNVDFIINNYNQLYTLKQTYSNI